MNAESEAVRAVLRSLSVKNGTAPSLRVPVTEGNRALLRRLRAAELSAWEAADRRPYRGRDH